MANVSLAIKGSNTRVRVLTAIFMRSVSYYHYATLVVNNDDGSN